MLRTGRSYILGKTLSGWVFGRVRQRVGVLKEELLCGLAIPLPETPERRANMRTYVHILCSNLIVRWVVVVVSPALRSLRHGCQFRTSSFQKTNKKGVGGASIHVILRGRIKNYTNFPRFIRNQDNGSTIAIVCRHKALTEI